MAATEQPYPAGDGMETEDIKIALRAAIRANRDQRSERRRAQCSQAFAIVASRVPAVHDATTVALYAARSGEPRTFHLIEHLHSQGKRVLLPVLGSGLARNWAWYTTTTDLTDRAPGRPPEPSGETLDADAIALADVIITPALAVDTAGRRLGQGGGWYDRVLPLARPDAPIFALVFPEEIYDAAASAIPVEEHDVPVDAAITTKQWQWLGDGERRLSPENVR